jgi:hypothetical protein
VFDFYVLILIYVLILRREAAHVLKRPPVKNIDGSLSGYIFYEVGGTAGGGYNSGRYGAEPRPHKNIFKILTLILTLTLIFIHHPYFFLACS